MEATKITMDIIIDNLTDYYNKMEQVWRGNFTLGSFTNFDSYILSIYKKKIFASEDLRKLYYAIKNKWSYSNDRIAYQSEEVKKNILTLFRLL